MCDEGARERANPSRQVSAFFAQGLCRANYLSFATQLVRGDGSASVVTIGFSEIRGVEPRPDVLICADYLAQGQPTRLAIPHRDAPPLGSRSGTEKDFKMKRKRISAGVAILAAGILAVAVASPAAAAVAPVPYDNTDPSATGCSSGAVVIASYPVTSTSTGAVVGTLEMRYSSACDTNWARMNNTLPGTTANKYIDRISSYNPGPPASGYTFNSQLDADPGLGWSYGLQLGGASGSCSHIGGWITDANGAVVATAGGQHVVC